MDANTDAQVAVTNVIVIPTSQSTKEDGVLQEFDLTSGTGYYACGGQYVEINWEKGDMYNPMTFTNADGQPAVWCGLHLHLHLRLQPPHRIPVNLIPETVRNGPAQFPVPGRFALGNQKFPLWLLDKGTGFR